MPEADEAYTEALKKCFVKNKIPVENMVLVLPRTAVTMRHLRFPTTTPSEIASMAYYWAMRFLPHSSNEVVWGHQITGRYQGHSDVTVFAALVRDVEKLLAYVAPWQEHITHSVVNSFGVPAVCQETHSGMHAVVVQDNTNIHIALTKNTKLLFSREVCITDYSIEFISSEIHKTLNAYMREHPQEQLAALHIDASLAEYVDARFGAPLRIFSPVHTLFYGLTQISLETLNMLPAQWAAKKLKKIITARAAQCAGILITALALFGAGMYIRYQSQSSYARALAVEADAYPAALRQFVSAQKNIQHERIEKSARVTDIFTQVYAAMPAGATWKQFSFEAGKGIRVVGASKNVETALAVLAACEKLPILKKVSMNHAANPSARSGEEIDFEMTAGVR